jgi:hypothetical protein
LTDSILTDEQAEAFIMSLADARKERGFNEEEAKKVLSWATDKVIEQTLFVGVMQGDMYIDVNEEGEVVFGITDQGVQLARSLVLGGRVGANNVQ